MTRPLRKYFDGIKCTCYIGVGHLPGRTIRKLRTTFIRDCPAHGRRLKSQTLI